MNNQEKWEKKMQYTKIALMSLFALIALILLVRIESNTRTCIEMECIRYEKINIGK